MAVALSVTELTLNALINALIFECYGLPVLNFAIQEQLRHVDFISSFQGSTGLMVSSTVAI